MADASTSLPAALVGLEPAPVWRHFAALAARPRPSGQEAAVRDYVLAWAAAKGFETQTDAIGNAVVRVPGRGAGVGAKPVIIQGHLDMVTEKNADSPHDFERDPIALRRIDGRIFATETTLGADNGIGVSLGLAAGDGLYADHPPLELLLTVDEETGMSGARELDAGMLTAERLLNLDAEEEGTIYVGCAGGQDTVATVAITREEAPDGAAPMQLTIRGLHGGHSGLDIGLNRGNAIRLMAHTLTKLANADLPVRLARIDGGSKRNAIPRECRVTLWLNASERGALEAQLPALREELYALHADSEDQVLVELDAEPTADAPAPFTRGLAGQVLSFLYLPVTGVISLSQAVEGLVETSNNLGVCETDEAAGVVRVTLCSRSSNMPALGQVSEQLAALARTCGFDVRQEAGYPGWQPDMSSSILATAVDVFRAMADGEEPEVTAIHAGLECGLLAGAKPGLDMVSFGPDIQNAHSPRESVSIASVGVVAEQVRGVLEALCEDRP